MQQGLCYVEVKLSRIESWRLRGEMESWAATVVSSTRRPYFTRNEIIRYSVLLEAEWIPGRHYIDSAYELLTASRTL